MVFICCGQAGLSQVSLLQNYFLVLCVPVSPVKASQRSRLAQWPKNTAPSPGQAEGPEPSYLIQGQRQGAQTPVGRQALCCINSEVLVIWD